MAPESHALAYVWSAGIAARLFHENGVFPTHYDLEHLLVSSHAEAGLLSRDDACCHELLVLAGTTKLDRPLAISHHFLEDVLAGFFPELRRYTYDLKDSFLIKYPLSAVRELLSGYTLEDPFAMAMGISMRTIDENLSQRIRHWLRERLPDMAT